MAVDNSKCPLSVYTEERTVWKMMMKGKIISTSIRRKVLEKKKEGLTHRKISNDLNISSKSIQRILKEGVKKEKKKKKIRL